MSWKNMFTGSEHAALYKRFRPTYPKELYDIIMDYLGEKLSPPYRQAIDVGCGSGQNTNNLAPYFDHVLGVDISESQVEEATRMNKLDNVHYRVGSFDDLFLPSESADLVTCAMSAHYFSPIDDFYKEADRVLKPGGVLAIFSYGVHQVSCEGYSIDDCSNLIWEFFRDERLRQYFVGPQYQVLHRYADFKLPYQGWKRIDSLTFDQTMTIAELLGFHSSFAFYQKYLQDGKGEGDPLQDLRKSFERLLGDDKSLSEVICTVSWPVVLILGRKQTMKCVDMLN